MVAVVHQSKSLRGILNYNETKVKLGIAACLDAGFYPMEAADMNFHQKLRRMELLTELNQRTKVNCLHVSINFHPSERFSETKLKEMAEVFMEKIGFGAQPYLLYQHFDAGHPHVHLVSTNIRSDGTAINLHNIGRDKARPACVAMEKEYGLVIATDLDKRLDQRFKPVNVARALYGKTETKRAMNGIINVVTDSYRFTSLAQLNAVLGLYHIVADTGGENSRVNKHKGLVFRMLDEQGNKVGVPIKASDFAGKPTLKNLQVRFAKNEPLKVSKKSRVANAVNKILLEDSRTLNDLEEALREQGIDLVVRQNADGVVYGLTYVDHQTKSVFNGSELGKAFGAKAILERCPNEFTCEGKKQNGTTKKLAAEGEANGVLARGRSGEKIDVAGLADALLVNSEGMGGMDWELKRTKRKKKKRLRLPPG